MMWSKEENGFYFPRNIWSSKLGVLGTPSSKWPLRRGGYPWSWLGLCFSSAPFFPKVSARSILHTQFQHQSKWSLDWSQYKAEEGGSQPTDEWKSVWCLPVSLHSPVSPDRSWPSTPCLHLPLHLLSAPSMTRVCGLTQANSKRFKTPCYFFHHPETIIRFLGAQTILSSRKENQTFVCTCVRVVSCGLLLDFGELDLWGMVAEEPTAIFSQRLSLDL
jgi:hypothetical protein